MLQAILFDLDGTLLPMDNEYFIKVYMRLLAKAAVPWGYTDSEGMLKSLWDGVMAMIQNQGKHSNFDAFWQVFSDQQGKRSLQDLDKFDHFYRTDFHQAKSATSPNALAATAVALAREKAQRVILATNPIFPRSADESRLSWLGLKAEDFDLVTDYENSRFCKPNPAYYREILEQFQLDPAQCLMIGNNVQEDWAAANAVGMPGYLVTDWLIGKEDAPLPCPGGTYEEMVEMLRNL
jgi:FMN phosphatase YigB (HAD superfamily)